MRWQSGGLARENMRRSPGRAFFFGIPMAACFSRRQFPLMNFELPVHPMARKAAAWPARMGGKSHGESDADAHTAGGNGRGGHLFFQATPSAEAGAARGPAGEQPGNGKSAQAAGRAFVGAAGGESASGQLPGYYRPGRGNQIPEGDSVRRESAACADLWASRDWQDLRGAPGAGGGETFPGNALCQGRAFY